MFYDVHFNGCHFWLSSSLQAKWWLSISQVIAHSRFAKRLRRVAVLTASLPPSKTEGNLLPLALGVQESFISSENALHASLNRMVLVTLPQKIVGKEKISYFWSSLRLNHVLECDFCFLHMKFTNQQM